MAKQRSSEGAGAPSRGSRAAYWQRQVAAWAASGLTQVEFCHRQGLSLASLRWWKWKLKAAGPAGGSRSRPKRSSTAKKRPTSQSAKPKLLPVRVVPSVEPGSGPGSQADRAEVYEVQLRGGHRILVPADFQPEVLHRLILTLEASAC